jgi:homoserine acetyltransferase
MQALEWAIVHPERVERAAIIAVAPLRPWGWRSTICSATRFCTTRTGRRALSAAAPTAPGLALARQIAMLSYKSAALFDERFGRNPNRNGEDPGPGRPGRRAHRRPFRHCRLSRPPGPALVERFDANAYLAILRTMDTWDPLHGHARRRRPSAASARGSALSASAPTGCFRRSAVRHLPTPFALPASDRLPRNDQRSRPRRLSGRAG